jgi:hypothetical protein
MISIRVALTVGLNLAAGHQAPSRTHIVRWRFALPGRTPRKSVPTEKDPDDEEQH